MIQVIAGEKGSGKTKKMISLSNDSIQHSKGHVIYLSNNSEAMYELNSCIRLIDISQFPISTVDSFTGFLYGIISEDYDIECMYIDNVNSIIKEDEDAMSRFFDGLKRISENHGIKFVLGLKAQKSPLPDTEIEYIAV